LEEGDTHLLSKGSRQYLYFEHIGCREKTSFLKVKEIAAKLNITAPRVNNILSEIGWIESATKGWKITPSGSEIGGVEKDFRGAKYVIWPTNIFENIVFKRSTSRLHDASEDPIDLIEKSSNDTSNNRKTYKTKDGHIVKSEGEVRIDDILYDSKIRHAYERELPINELYYCDFYIPGEGNRKPIYIEYWGVEKEYSGKNKISYEEYYKQKKHKQEIYERLKLNLINVEPVHKENLYRHLEVELLKYDMALE